MKYVFTLASPRAIVGVLGNNKQLLPSYQFIGVYVLIQLSNGSDRDILITDETVYMPIFSL